jgi:hypothetical protein
MLDITKMLPLSFLLLSLLALIPAKQGSAIELWSPPSAELEIVVPPADMKKCLELQKMLLPDISDAEAAKFCTAVYRPLIIPKSLNPCDDPHVDCVAVNPGRDPA